MTKQTWKLDSHGSWFTAQNWTSGMIPGATDDVTASTLGTILINGIATVNSLTVAENRLEISGCLIIGTSLMLTRNSSFYLLGGTLAVQSIDVIPYGHWYLQGFGTVELTGEMNGRISISATGGTLKLNGQFSSFNYYAGNLLTYHIDLGSTLELSHGSSSNVIFSSASFVNGIFKENPGTLRLNTPELFEGTIYNLSIGDMIHIIDTNVYSVNINFKGDIIIDGTSGQQFVYETSGMIGGNRFSRLLFTADSDNGTIVYVTQKPLTETTTIQQEIAGLYAAIYKRTVDDLGMRYWIETLNKNKNITAINLESAASINVSENDANLLGKLFVSTQSTYFNSLYGNLSDTEFIDALYFNLLGGADIISSSKKNYWVSEIKNNVATGIDVQNSRAAILGNFVRDSLELDLEDWISSLAPDDLGLAIQHQSIMNNKISVSLAYLNASARSAGSFLNAVAIDDAAFNAQMTALAEMVVTPIGASTMALAINSALANNNFESIQLVGALIPQPHL